MKKTIESFLKDQAVLIFIIVGLQILYAGYHIIKVIGVIGLDFELFLEPIILFSLILNALIIYLGIAFFKMNQIGWYGITSLYSFIFLKCTLIFVLGIFLLVFGPRIFKNIELPILSMNSKVLWEFMKLIVSGIMIKMLYSDDTLNGIGFKRFTKRDIIIKSVFLTIVVIVIFCGINFFIIKIYN